MKLPLLLSLLIALTALAKDNAVLNTTVPNTAQNDKTIAPSADFIELTEAYKNRTVVSPEKNAFVYLMGITAPEGKDPITVGQSSIDWLNKKIDNGGKNESPKPNVPYLYPISENFGKLMQKIHCSIREATFCSLDSQQAFAREVIHNNQRLLKRRHKLLDYAVYQNTLTIDLRMLILPNYNINIQLQRLALIDLWLNRHDYSPEKIKQTLQKDYNFYLRQAANAVTLVEKMVAVAALRNHYYWLNEILKSVDNNTAALLTPDYLQQPIPLSALSLRTAYTGELQFFISLFKSYNITEDSLIVYPISDNDKQQLFNYKATLLKKLINISESDNYQRQLNHLANDKTTRQYIASFKAVSKKSGENWHDIFGSTDGFVVLVASITVYIDRTRQLVAIQKAVNVLNTIRRQGIESDAIPAFLKQAEYANPLTQKPFLWDDDRQQIIINESKKVKYYLSL